MQIIAQIVIVLFSIIIHEVSHGYAALSLGDKTAKYAGRLTLNPIKHIDPFGTIILPILLAIGTKGAFVFGWAKPVPYNPYNLSNQKWGDALVAGAGPLSNILIATFFSLLMHAGVNFGLVNQAFIDISVFVVMVNIALAMFNLLPIPPLDGSKILFSFLPYQYLKVRHWLERYGFFILLAFIYFFGDFFFQDIVAPVIGLFL